MKSPELNLNHNELKIASAVFKNWRSLWPADELESNKLLSKVSEEQISNRLLSPRH